MTDDAPLLPHISGDRPADRHDIACACPNASAGQAGNRIAHAHRNDDAQGCEASRRTQPSRDGDEKDGDPASEVARQRSSSFLKKRTKKLLSIGTRVPPDKSFLLLFFKKEVLPSCSYAAKSGNS
jgi:hypothetical protein